MLANIFKFHFYTKERKIIIYRNFSNQYIVLRFNFFALDFRLAFRLPLEFSLPPSLGISATFG
jgi:hypothetical protein